MKKLLFLTLLALTGLIACSQEAPPAERSTTPPVAATAAPARAWVEVVTTAGNFTLELNGEAAPLTVAQFLRNVDSGFYKGLIFHRVIPGFMIQGGGYTEDLVERESTQTIPNESGNGLANLRSTIAMARTSDPHSASSQFYINVVNNIADDPTTASLDPIKHTTGGRWGYTVFGHVAEGMDVIDLIAQYETEPNGPGGAPLPIIPVVIESMKRVQR